MITVAIPAYNGSMFIEEAVNSILSQTCRIEEIIIIDDSSTDNTVNKAEEIIERNSGSKIRLVVNENNIGYQANWNRCMELCTTRYLLILHQDDKLESQSCRILFDFLKEKPELALVGGHEVLCDVFGMPLNQKRVIKSDRIFNRGQIYEFVTEESSYIPCSSVMFDMEKIREVGGFETDISATDELYWPRVLTKFPIAILGVVLIFRRIHKDQAEYHSFIEDEKKALAIYDRFRKISLLEERKEYRDKIVSFQKRKFYIMYIGTISVYLARIGHIRLSFRYLIKAFSIYPVGIFQLWLLWKGLLKIIYFTLQELIRRVNKYSKGLSESFSRHLVRKYFLDELEASLVDCNTVLELGAGKFSYLRMLEKKLFITALDIDQKSLDIAQEANVYDEYIRGDVKTIGDCFPEASVDCVVAFDLIEHLGKDDGLEMITNMEKIALKKIIVYTPNGFLFQDIIDGNIYQRHISGWSYSEMKRYSFRVFGINGLKIFRGPLALPRIRPYIIGYFISNISWIMLKALGLDKFAFSILCIKEKK